MATLMPPVPTQSASLPSSASAPLHVLIIDDEPTWHQAYRALLTSAAGIPPLHIDTVTTPQDALHQLAAHPYDRILIDWDMRNTLTGLDVANRMVSQLGYQPHQLAIVSATPPEQLPHCPYTFIPKPKAAKQLAAWVFAPP